MKVAIDNCLVPSYLGPSSFLKPWTAETIGSMKICSRATWVNIALSFQIFSTPPLAFPFAGLLEGF